MVRAVQEIASRREAIVQGHERQLNAEARAEPIGGGLVAGAEVEPSRHGDLEAAADSHVLALAAAEIDGGVDPREQLAGDSAADLPREGLRAPTHSLMGAV